MCQSDGGGGGSIPDLEWGRESISLSHCCIGDSPDQSIMGSHPQPHPADRRKDWECRGQHALEWKTVVIKRKHCTSEWEPVSKGSLSCTLRLLIFPNCNHFTQNYWHCKFHTNSFRRNYHLGCCTCRHKYRLVGSFGDSSPHVTDSPDTCVKCQ